MASAPVLEALEELHNNLDKMKPAIKQFQIAEKLTEEVNKLPGIHTTFITELHQVERDYHALLQRQMQDHEAQLNTRVEEVVSSASNTINSMSDHNEQILKLRNNIQSYYSKLDGMQLPVKLDTLQKTSDEKLGKLDSNAISILTSIQNLQTKLDLLERNLKDHVREETEKQVRYLQSMQEKLSSKLDLLTTKADDQANKQKLQQLLTFVTWLMVAIVAGLILYFKK